MTTHRSIALIVVADEPALFYDSIASAELDLEAIDVRDGVYGPLLGPCGEIYRISAIGERVVITADPTAQNDPATLQNILVNYVQHVMPQITPANDLAGLLHQCRPFLEQIFVKTKIK